MSQVAAFVTIAVNEPERVRIELVTGRLLGASLPLPLAGPIALEELSDIALVVSRGHDTRLDLLLEDSAGSEKFRLRVQTGSGCRVHLEIGAPPIVFDVAENEDQILVIT